MELHPVPEITSITLPTGVDLQFLEQGERDGLPLVLIHGYSDSWRSFELLLPHLPPSLHVFAFTQRGHGDSSKPENGYDTQNFVEDLTAFCDAIGLTEVVVVSASSGGFVARQFAIDHPDRTRGLVLLGSPLTLRGIPAVQELWESTISHLTDPVERGFVEQFQLGTLANAIPSRFLETVVDEARKVPAHVWRAAFSGLLADRSEAWLSRIDAPTLLIWGGRDAIVDREAQHIMLGAIPRSGLLIYPDAGHTFYWEASQRVADDLAEFMQTLPGGEDS